MLKTKMCPNLFPVSPGFFSRPERSHLVPQQQTHEQRQVDGNFATSESNAKRDRAAACLESSSGQHRRQLCDCFVFGFWFLTLGDIVCIIAMLFHSFHVHLRVFLRHGCASSCIYISFSLNVFCLCPFIGVLLSIRG